MALDAESAEVLGNIKALLMKKGWQTKPLGDLCDVLDHKRKPITKRDREAGKYPSRVEAAGWGVVEGSRIRREYQIAPGRIEGHRKRGKPLKYHNSIQDAVADLGKPEETGKVFASFQRFLYVEQVT